jgi:EAL domain-containing protein (putative c-di-GMP-specific phosphodiesterase class I)
VAEGVETAADAAILHREGIGFLQGYYYGRPSLDRPWLQTPADDIFADKKVAAGA